MAWYNSSWLKRKKITLQQSQVDADLTDYPVMVNLADADILASARGDLRDVLFTAADETTKLSHELVKRRFVGAGGWTWFNNPRAIYHNGTHQRTYAGSIDGLGNLYVTQYTHTTGVAVTTLLTATLEVDDHDNPALVIRPSDSKLVALYAKHNADTSLRFKIATNAEDATAWGSESTTTYSGNVTYANPIILPDDSHACYVFSRIQEATNDWRWSYKKTVDFSMWGSEVEIWDGGATQSYLHCARNGTGRIDFFVSDMHPDAASGTSLYHFYAAWDSGTSALKWYNSAGTEKTLPLAPGDVTLVYDGSGGNDGWNHQIAIDGSGYPRVLFQQRVSTSGTHDWRCMFSRWNGSAWITPVEITAHGGYVYSGQLAYTGGSCFDGSDIDTVYLGKEVSGVYEIQEWATPDSGATWAKTRDITSGSTATFKNIRPFSPLGNVGRLACLWSAGMYNTYIDYNLSTVCHPPLVVESYVKVPTVSGSTDTDIYCYYGNAAAADQEDATGAWNSGYQAVFHLEFQPANTVQPDSTSHAITATKKSYTEPSNSVLGGQKFDGVDDYITLGTAINLAGWTGATVEALINYDGLGNSGDEHQIISSWKLTTTESALMLRIEPTAGGRGLEGFAIREANTQVGGSFGLTVTVDQDEFVGMVYDTTSLRGYLNATEGGTPFSTGAAFDAGATGTTYLGTTGHTATELFGGTIYEIRLSNVARSAAWMKATSINLKTPTSFYTFGTEVGNGVTLVVQNATHGHSAESPNPIQDRILVLQDALHLQLVSGNDPDDALQEDGDPLLTEAGEPLAWQEASLALTQAHMIALSDALHGHAADSTTLTQAHTLAPQEASHGHSADALTLTQAYVLSLADSLHSHSVDSVSMGQGYVLTVADAGHGHSAESPTVSVAFVLAVQDALHSQAATEIVLATNITLIVSDALHAHLAGSAREITLPTGDRIFLVAHEDRLFLVAAEDRLFGV